MVLVEIRCKSCRKVLGTVTRRPATWDGNLDIRVCGDHTEGAIRRGGFLGWARSQVLAGRQPPFMATLGQRVPWVDLRSSIEKAERGGKTEVWGVGYTLT